MKCLYCGKEFIKRVDPEEPFCSQYCFEVSNGIPMPWSDCIGYEIEEKYLKLNLLRKQQDLTGERL